MRHYRIYLIEEQFAKHYFGREKMLLQLFVDYEHANGARKQLLKKQIEYITQPIPTQTIHKLLVKQLHNQNDNNSHRKVHSILLPDNKSYAKLVVYEEYMQLTAEGSYEAEAVFFEIIRKFDPCFLAMDIQLDRYGWLKPVKMNAL
ncbi:MULTISPECIES: sporulation inhibitor of replication protein SirA [Bacillaceae]|uniref:sporulation inhibitor of replication protein SirA n=1 Tax=Bacillaceae TaxID=186817 RepID=UPI001BDE8879|nr:sporulation inhibitor of replication protein SirA [Cytobacillus sp. IB215316]MDX8360185.1 sporulation inhibitor of replication protein SirA [Cytobacillus sp. IB215316]